MSDEMNVLRINELTKEITAMRAQLEAQDRRINGIDAVQDDHSGRLDSLESNQAATLAQHMRLLTIEAAIKSIESRLQAITGLTSRVRALEETIATPPEKLRHPQTITSFDVSIDLSAALMNERAAHKATAELLERYKNETKALKDSWMSLVSALQMARNDDGYTGPTRREVIAAARDFDVNSGEVFSV